ncbi:MAG: TonB-dependent receptor plug domain-containing protein, partial [Candidatus Competibacteraceae bacterium]|nr:TonB-dependent receptor plug domain-containing protein [Candidatus Competibacteraceae bacterium]
MRKPISDNKTWGALILVTGLALSSLLRPVAAAAPDLTGLNIEDLMQVTVISAARQYQPWADSAAAVFVITNEDIRRSGVTTLTEALRLAPGMEVARIDANRWAISIRGFNGRFANKLLVMIDGRSIYTPAFSGVYWEIQDLPLGDIDRIEVI